MIPNDLISARKAAVILTVSTATVYRMVAAGELSPYRVRSLLRVSEAEVRSRIQPGRPLAAPPRQQVQAMTRGQAEALEQLRAAGYAL